MPEADFETVVFVDGSDYFIKSSAILHIIKQLGEGWQLLFFLILIPSILRDAVYDTVVRNRYKWFGKMNHCLLPAPSVRDRFLD